MFNNELDGNDSIFSHEPNQRDDISTDSHNFQKMINFYQNEKKGKISGGNQKLPKHVTTLISEANSFYLDKKFEEAIDYCQEAVRIFPENPEPYHLLSVINGEKGDMKRAVDFLFIETQLSNQSDKDSWWKIADKYYN